jgi:hypothetical protein
LVDENLCCQVLLHHRTSYQCLRISFACFWYYHSQIY